MLLDSAAVAEAVSRQIGRLGELLSRVALNRLHQTLALLGCALVALAGLAVPATGQDTLPAVSIVLLLDVQDSGAWLEAYQEILATPPPSPKTLVVTIVPLTPPRSIRLAEPMFSTTVSGAKGPHIIRLIVKGKIAGNDAASTLSPFMRSLVGTSGPNTVSLDYGLSQFTADLVELRTLDR